MSSDEEFFSSLKKKRKISERSCSDVVSSEEDTSCDHQTPETSCAKRSAVTGKNNYTHSKMQQICTNMTNLQQSGVNAVINYNRCI